MFSHQFFVFLGNFWQILGELGKCKAISIFQKWISNRVNNWNFQIEFLISDQCGWWAVRAREFTVVEATTTSTPIWWITTGNNGSGQNEAAAAANLLLQTCLRPFHSIFSDKFLRRQLFFGLIIFSKLSVYSGRLHTLTKYRLSTYFSDRDEIRVFTELFGKRAVTWTDSISLIVKK